QLADEAEPLLPQRPGEPLHLLAVQRGEQPLLALGEPRTGRSGIMEERRAESAIGVEPRQYALEVEQTHRALREGWPPPSDLRRAFRRTAAGSRPPRRPPRRESCAPRRISVAPRPAPVSPRSGCRCGSRPPHARRPDGSAQPAPAAARPGR